MTLISIAVNPKTKFKNLFGSKIKEANYLWIYG